MVLFPAIRFILISPLGVLFNSNLLELHFMFQPKVEVRLQRSFVSLRLLVKIEAGYGYAGSGGFAREGINQTSHNYGHCG
jgi:hypothetical protein